MPRLAVVSSLALLLLLAACGGDEPGPSEAGASTAAPTKAALVATLRELMGALERGDEDAAVGLLVVLPGLEREDLKRAIPSFTKNREISPAGIDVLEAKGRFGPLLEILPKDGALRAERAGVDPAACWALVHGGAEVVAVWDGGSFRLFRVDDVGKLGHE